MQYHAPGLHVRTAFSTDSAVVLDGKTGTYYSFGAIETKVWSALLSGQPLSETIRSLADEYDQPAETIDADVSVFLERLSVAGLCCSYKSTGAASLGLWNWLGAAYHLGRAWCLLKLRGFAALARSTRSCQVRRKPAPEIDRLVATFNHVRLFDLTGARCLQYASALTRYLRRRGVPAECVIGVRREPFMAHAWVELNGVVLAGTQNRSNYVVIDRL